MNAKLHASRPSALPAGINRCLSSYDDRPPHFIAPWEFDGSPRAAFEKLSDVVKEYGGVIQRSEQGHYLWVTFGGATDTDDAEFLFAQDDNTVSKSIAVVLVVRYYGMDHTLQCLKFMCNASSGCEGAGRLSAAYQASNCFMSLRYEFQAAAKPCK